MAVPDHLDEPSGHAGPPTGWHFSPRQTFSALRFPNYRRWFVGQLVSVFGSWMQGTAQGFLAFQLTGSAAYLGYISFAAGIPAWLLMLYGGVVADRRSRRWILVIAQSAMMIQAFVLAGLTFAGAVRPWHLVVLATGLGVITAFEAPARQAFLLEMVDRESLTNAIALNMTLFNLATSLGPAAAGLVYAAVGPAWCFTVNGLSFIAVIAALLFMRLTPMDRRPRHAPALQEVRQGLRFVVEHRLIRLIIVGLAASSAFGFGMFTLMPAWAVQVLHGHARTNGLLFSARGIGSLLGALMIAALGQFRRGRLLTLGSFTLPTVIVLFSVLRWLPLSLLALVAVGWCLTVLHNLFNSLMQAHTPEELRGRVMSIYTLTFFGLSPIGALIVGTLANRLSAPAAVLTCAAVLLTCATIAFRWFPELRRVDEVPSRSIAVGEVQTRPAE